MSTKWCHQCGSEFVARVRVCPDCGVELRDEPPGEGGAGEGPVPESTTPRLSGEPGEQLVYELHEWPGEARRQLEQLLTSRDAASSPTDPRGGAVPHAWQGTDLVIPAAVQEQVDVLVDEVEAAIELTEGLVLDADADKLAYEVTDLDEEQVTELLDALVDAGLPHQFVPHTGELFVQASDEEAVEEILDAVDFPDALPADDAEDAGDGLDAQEVLSDLFVAADRLRKRADDPDGVLTLAGAAERAASMRPPYGFDDAAWKAIVERAGGVRELLDGDVTDEAGDAAIRERADELRSTLRPYV